PGLRMERLPSPLRWRRSPMFRVFLPWVLVLAVPFFLVIGDPITPVPVTRVIAAEDDKAVAGDDELVGKVRQSISDGVAFLRAQQRRADGSWEVSPMIATGNPGGMTALAVLALLNAGVSVNDEAVQNGLAYLRKVEPAKTYVVGLQTMAFCHARQPQDKER